VSGRTIAHYRLVEPLGSGGRGDVYRAEDVRLGRQVALRLLPPALAGDPDARARFEREARRASSLGHPHICPVHDVDEADGQLFIVMELCAGSTVADLLAHGPLPLNDALQVAGQVADALAAIHAQGFVHGSLSSRRVFVGPDRQVKVVLSPERAGVRPTDRGVDLRALGVLLHEMVTGRPPALAPGAGGDVADDVPGSVTPLLRRLLASGDEDGYRRASDAVDDLRAAKRELTAGRPPRPVRRRWLRALVTGAALTIVVAIAAATAFRAGRGTTPLSERDVILLAGFQNDTGLPVFDDTLFHALAVQLTQSPFLNLVAEERVRETLRQMGRAPDEHPTGDVAREVCQRLGLKAAVRGSISRRGTGFLVVADAVNCETAGELARAQGEAARQEDVLQTVGAISSALRSQLGESLKSVRQFDVPIARATTPSLDALKAYTVGLARRARGAELESIPFLERALELDPTFAAAATTLSTVYGNLGEPGRSEEYARRAYDNRAHVSERERLFIEYQYYDRVTGDQRQVATTLEVWKQTYPNDFLPANALAILYNRIGRFDRGVEEAGEALRRSPGHPFPLSNLAHAYRGLGRYDEARRVAEEAVRLRVETVPTRRLLYQLAVLRGDRAGAAEQLRWAEGNPREFDMTAAQAQVAAYEGRLAEANALYTRTTELARGRALPEIAGSYLAHQALTLVLYGDRARALLAAREALSSAPADGADSVPRFRAVAALALLGDAEGVRLAEAAAAAHPQSVVAGGVLLPVTRAAFELSRGRGREAVEHLRAAAPYETGTLAVLVPIYLRGAAFLLEGQGGRAREEFDRILAHRGSDPFSPVCALAPLGLARAWRAMGDSARSAAAYDTFLASWAGADADVPVLAVARRERALLTVPR
jgi:tetratricopeptide (TPR) repeat protein